MITFTTKEGFEIVHPQNAEDVEALLTELIGGDSVDCHGFIDVLTGFNAGEITNIDKSAIKAAWVYEFDLDLHECVDICSLSEWLWGRSNYEKY